MKYLVETLLFLIIGVSGTFLKAQTSIDVFSDSLFKANIEQGNIAGGAALIVKSGNVLLDQSYGFASLELEVPMPEDAIFEIGSVTKQFTAAATLKLVEAGKLALEEDFTKYLDYDTKGRKVTIYQLLNHTSGIPSYTEVSGFWDLSIEQHDRDSLVRMVEQEQFLFEPGEAMIYNNSAYFFLGLIIEKVSGMPYEDYLRKTIFEPLGMENTFYCSSSAVQKNRVYGYNFSPNGLQQKPYLNHLWPYAAGSLCSNTDDLLTWMKALHSGKVLENKEYQLMIAPAKLNDGTALRYGMGLLPYNMYGHYQIGHGGGIHGFLSETRYFPDEELYIICLINTTGPRGAGFFSNAFNWRLLEKEFPKKVKVDVDINKYKGNYSGQARGRILNITVDVQGNNPILQIEGQPKKDTLNHYIGNGTWYDDNQFLIFQEDQIKLDNLGGYYLLKKK